MTKLIPILSGRCLVVELPEGAHSPVVDDYLLGFNLPAPKWAGDWSDDSYDTIKLPPGNWHIVGMLSEVTEEQADEIVSKVINGQHFQNYAFTSPVNRWVKTALESLESSILAEGYYLDENPIPEPDISRYPNDDWIADYNNAQSRVLCRERCLLLGREI